MEISIRKTASTTKQTLDIIKELEAKLSDHEEEFPTRKALMLIDEAAEMLEGDDKYKEVYNAIMKVIKMFSSEDDEVKEINSSDDLEEDVQEEIEEQKEE